MEWKDHDGGPCPIPNVDAGNYEIRTLDGEASRPRCESSRAGWGRFDERAKFMEIVAYRVLNP